MNQATTRAKLIRRDGYHCRYCGCAERNALTIEHLTPRSRGGTDGMYNLALSCFRCNEVKGTKTDEEFRAWIKVHGLPRMRKDGWRARTETFVQRRKRQRKAAQVRA